jgi:arylsulfatase A-like enzyme
MMRRHALVIESALMLAGLSLLGPTAALSSAEDAAAPSTGLAAGTTQDDRPNILIINLDDMRATGTLGVMPRVREYFQQRGRTYPRNYASTPLCAPSRASLLTGRYPHNHGVTGNGLDAEVAALDQSAMIQGYLRAAGYNTAMTGKYLNPWPLSRNPSHWDRWRVVGGYTDASYNDQGNVRRIPGYYTLVMGDHAVASLAQFEQQDDKPWLLYIAPIAPHSPSTPEAVYATAQVPAWTRPPSFNEPDISDKPTTARWSPRDPASMEQVRTEQLRTLMSVDDMVDRVVDEMTRLGEDERTLAIFTSDNGYFWGEHRFQGKRLPYEEAQVVPLLVRWPGHVPPGTTDDRLVSNVDMLPTLLEAAGVSPILKAPLDGISLFSPARRTHLLIEYGRSLDAPLPPWTAVRSPGVQYTQWYDAASGAPTENEYYDVAGDPFQLTNILGDGIPSNDPDLTSWRGMVTALRSCAGAGCVMSDVPVNRPPVARVSVDCDHMTCRFSGATSTDPDGSIVSYQWDFGDGAEASMTPSPSHVYLVPGTYAVRLTVTDDGGLTDAVEQNVTVPAGSLAFRAGSAATTNGTSLSVRTPADVGSDDLMLLLVTGNRTDVQLSGPAGWERLGTVSDSSLQSAVWWRKAVAPADAGATVTVQTTLNTKLDAHLLVYSGSAASRIAAHAAAAEPGLTAAHTTPTVTVPASGGWLISYWSDRSPSGSGWASPADVLRRFQTVGTGDGRVTALSGDSGRPLAGGTAGSITATSTVTSSRAVTWSIVVTP